MTAKTVSLAKTDDTFNVITATKGLIAKGDRYNQASVAAIAHILATNIEGGKIKRGVAAALAAELSYDKGNMSRIAKVVTTDAKARKAAMAVDILHIDDDESTLTAAVKVGSLFARKPATKSSLPKAEKNEETDVLALVTEWLTSATDEQYGPRKAQVENMLATIDSERAAAQAARDAAADEVAA